MPTTTHAPAAKASSLNRRGARRLAYTLGELLVATGLSGMILAGVLSSVLMISKSGYLLNNYVEMETQARNALENFALDVRMAENIQWTRASASAPLDGLTLTIPSGEQITYTYDSVAGTLTRQEVHPSVGDARTVISGIETLTFIAYKIDTEMIEPTGSTIETINLNTKQVQISLSARRSRTNVTDATNTVVSARFVLRNKRVTA